MTIRMPRYRHHKARGLAVVTLHGKDHYLGRYDSPESHQHYHRLLAEYCSQAATGQPPTPSASQVCKGGNNWTVQLLSVTYNGLTLSATALLEQFRLAQLLLRLTFLFFW